jgi:hypothetical protein
MAVVNRKIAALWLLAAAAVAAMLFVEPIAQDPAYHEFSDRREIGGIPNFSDVLSNLPFLIIGILGFVRARGLTADRLYWCVFFVGVAGVALGSAYYHWNPANGTLLWDRLPMTVAFMALFVIVIADRISGVGAARIFLPLLILGVASVLWWHWSEVQGRGDLRWYGLVQFFPILLMVLMVALFPSQHGGTHLLLLAFAAYGLAKLCELFDVQVHGFLGFVSGHTLKHLAAALATWLLYRMMCAREANSQTFRAKKVAPARQQ